MSHSRKMRAAAAALLPVALATTSISVSSSEPSQATTDSIRNHLRSGKLRFTDIATRAETGISYRRQKSPRDSLAERIRMKPAVTFMDAFFYPTKPRGAPGVALFDFDRTAIRTSM